MKIGIDIDGVIANSIEEWLYEICKRYPCFTPDINKIKSFTTEIITGLTTAEVMELFLNVVINGEIEPYEDAVESIKSLKNSGHKIYILTSRSETTYDNTIKWLKDIGVEYHDIVFFGESTTSKSEFADFSGLNVVIDDNIMEYVNNDNPKLTKILMSRPWNKTYNLSDTFIVCNDWKDVMYEIENIEILKEIQ
jgi:5'(3')-deoxyribonucleotidase